MAVASAQLYAKFDNSRLIFDDLRIVKVRVDFYSWIPVLSGVQVGLQAPRACVRACGVRADLRFGVEVQTFSGWADLALIALLRWACMCT